MAGDNAGDPIRCAIAEQVASLPVIERALRADADDAVHQLRVSIRRIRSLLRAVPGSFSDIDGELRWLAGVLGTARDAEVLAQR
ncbi:CHAD domain-containing protein, partial [Mycolicibacter senuensis]|uniref:CHAD domain-containing protein n=1 Tax=Mycolicibacter senuensis TaxID=386913 RepID=UPI000DCDC075